MDEKNLRLDAAYRTRNSSETRGLRPTISYAFLIFIEQIQDLIRNLIDHQFLSHGQVVDVVLGGLDGGGDGGLLVGLGGARNQGNCCIQADAYEIWIEGGAGEGESNCLV